MASKQCSDGCAGREVKVVHETLTDPVAPLPWQENAPETTVDPGATELDFTHMYLTAIPDVSACSQLQTLVLRTNLIDKIVGLETVQHLTSLDFYENRLSKVEGLDNLPALTHLDLSFNECRLIQGLHHNVNLKTLFLVNNKIPRIPPMSLDHLSKLRLLELGSNRLRCIENLAGLTSLEELYLGRNKIVELKGLQTLCNLRILSVQSNRLESIGDGLACCTNLEELYLSHNGLQTIEGLQTLTKLRVLDLSSNRVRHVVNVSSLVKLEDVWLNNNQLGSWEELTEFRSPHVTTVYLEHNPLYRDSAYLAKVRQYFPTVQQIDADEIQHQ